MLRRLQVMIEPKFRTRPQRETFAIACELISAFQMK